MQMLMILKKILYTRDAAAAAVVAIVFVVAIATFIVLLQQIFPWDFVVFYLNVSCGSSSSSSKRSSVYVHGQGAAGQQYKCRFCLFGIFGFFLEFKFFKKCLLHGHKAKSAKVSDCFLLSFVFLLQM